MAARKRSRQSEPEMSAAEIVDICARRAKARDNRDFDEADRLRDVLRERGVKLYDRDNVWVTADERTGPIRSKAERGMSTAEIVTLIEERVDARRHKDWDTADGIRDKLRSKGVQVYDADKKWEVPSDGRKGTWGRAQPQHQQNNVQQLPLEFPAPAVPPLPWPPRPELLLIPPPLAPAPPDHFPMALHPQPPLHFGGGAASIPVMPTEVIECLLGLREEHRRLKAFTAADQIRDVLITHAVRIHDRDGKWDAIDGRAGRIPKTGSDARPTPLLGGGGPLMPPLAPPPAARPPPPLTKTEIEETLHQRELFRANRDYTSADNLRNSLRARGVVILDKERHWKYKDLEGQIV